MAVSKVVMNTSNGEQTLIDLTADDISSDKVFEGVQFHASDGSTRAGTFTLASEMSEQDALIEQVKIALQGKASGTLDLTEEMSEQDALIEQIKIALQGKAAGG